MAEIFSKDEYGKWIGDLKLKIRTRQVKAVSSVNAELIRLYWEIGLAISERQENSGWGDNLIERVAQDLKRSFPEMSGFSKTNLVYCRKFYRFYTPDFFADYQFGEQLVHQIPWGHHILLLKKVETLDEAYFYLQETVNNSWSRNILQLQIESNLFKRQGKSPNNFATTLPKPQSDLAGQIIKDPYNFGFLTLEKEVQESDFEKQLTNNITDFLLELGKGFSFVGRQFPVMVGDTEYRLDLLFYHLKLRCFVVIELKMGEFQPEYIGKLNFYLSAVDDLLKAEMDKSSIGILLCKTKENLAVEFSLRDVNKPIGVSEFGFNELPLEIRKEMPSVEEFEREMFPEALGEE